jgi:hypothetical protein
MYTAGVDEAAVWPRSAFAFDHDHVDDTDVLTTVGNDVVGLVRVDRNREVVTPSPARRR